MRTFRKNRPWPGLRLPVFLLLLVAVVANEAGGETTAGMDRYAADADRQGPYALRIAQAAVRCVVHFGQLAGDR